MTADLNVPAVLASLTDDQFDVVRTLLTEQSEALIALERTAQSTVERTNVAVLMLQGANPDDILGRSKR